MVTFPRNMKRLQKFRRCCFSGDNALEFECVIKCLTGSFVFAIAWYLSKCWKMSDECFSPTIEGLPHMFWMHADILKMLIFQLTASWVLRQLYYMPLAHLLLSRTGRYLNWRQGLGFSERFRYLQFRKFGNLYCLIQIDVYTCQCNTPSKLRFVKLV